MTPEIDAGPTARNAPAIMFTIIGGDGKEYGPATVEQIRAWVGDGRANLDTQARRTSEDQWQRLGDFPEFNPTNASLPPLVAGQIPASEHNAPSAAADELIARAAPLDIFDCLKRGWDSGRAHFGPLLGVTLLIGLCAGMAGAIPLIGLLSSLFLNGVFYGGLYFYCLKKVRGEPTALGDAFSGFTVCFLPLMLTTLVSVLLTVVGLFCLILPGIYLAVAWFFAYLVVREKMLPFWEGMELCRKVVTAQWWRVFGLFIMLMLVSWALLAIPVALFIGGGLASQTGPNPTGITLFAFGGLGLLIAVCVMIPFFTATIMLAYDHLFNPPSQS